MSPTAPNAGPAPAAPPKSDASRRRWVEAAYAQFLRHGYHGTSMRAIADQAGMAVGGLYHHFAGKDEIFAAVLDAYHPYHAVLPALEATQGDTVDAFVRDAAGRFKAGMDDAGARLLPLLLIEIIEHQGRHLRALSQQIAPALFTFLERLQTRPGRLRGLPAAALLRTLFALLIGFLFTDLMLRGLSPAPHRPDLDDDPWFDAMIDIYLHGILAPSEASA